jgi:hypothetical protein
MQPSGARLKKSVLNRFDFDIASEYQTNDPVERRVLKLIRCGGATGPATQQ